MAHSADHIAIAAGGRPIVPAIPGARLGIDSDGFFDLVIDVIDRVDGLGSKSAYLKQRMRDKLTEHEQYITELGQDMPEILRWRLQ